ncbi:MAG: HlyC/CorC family transporter [Firmicutes bacterium]|nr:HlyC/CorC family transporter [Bacillota bacterium]
MDGSITVVISIAVLLLMSAYFSATETAFSSLSKIRLKNLISTGNKRAELTLSLAENYDRLISTILIGNNIVNILIASLMTAFFVKYYGNVGVSIATGVSTVLVLIFGEISPKSFAIESPESFAMFSAPILKFLDVILSPINFLFVYWKKFLSLFIKVSDERAITEEDLLTFVEEARQDGGINQQEGDLIRSVIEFDDLEAVDILTPRVDVVAVSDTATLDEIKQVFIETGYSRLPVFKGTIDNVIGILHHKDFYNSVLSSGKPLKSVLQPAVFITKSMKISSVLSLLQQSKSHIAIIKDEFGGTSGIITMEDILEELVGEIWDEHDEVVTEFEQISEDEYRVLCSISIDKVFDFFGIKDEVDVSTVSGWVIEEFGRIPNEGDQFEYGNLTVIVSKTDYCRVLEVVIRVNENLSHTAS